MSKRVIILGAGPAGLSAGWELAKEGAEVIILEKEPQVGGLCRSTLRDGFIFDLGGHRFITKDSLVLTQLEELMGEELVLRTRKSEILLQGKFFTYPIELADAVKKLDPHISFKAGIDFLLTRLGVFSNMPEVSFQDWVVKRFGWTMYNLYFGPYSQKLWGIPPKQLSAAWASQRISLINITDVILRALGRKKDMPKTYARNFLYPKKGIGQISWRMVEEIEKKNGKVHLNCQVKKIIMKGKQIEKIVYLQDGQEKSLEGDFVISTIPLPEFLLNVEPKVEAGLTALAGKMGFRGIRFLHLMLNRELVTENTWIYVPEDKYLFFRIQDRRNWSPTIVPPGKNALTLEIACTRGDSVWEADDQEILERCLMGLEELKLITRSEVNAYFTEKVEHAYPVYALDYQEKVQATYKFLSGIEKFICIGRQGLYRYNNMDHSLKMGILSAKHILHGYPKHKILSIATENIIFDWQDPGYHDGISEVLK